MNEKDVIKKTKEDILNKAREIQKSINQKKELADIRDVLKNEETKITDSASIFFELFYKVGQKGNDETSKLRQFTFLFSFIMILIKASGMPKEVKQNLINQLNEALAKNKI